MKLDQLRKIIREEVRAAVKEELQDVINEAIKYASQPTPQAQTTNEYKPVQKGQPKKWSVGKSASLDEMLAATKQAMTRDDFNNVMGASAPSAPNFASQAATKMGMTESAPLPGIDITKLPFMNKAKKILDMSMEVDKRRLG
jgi:hypothetical protein